MSINRRTALQLLLSGTTVGVLAACGAPTPQSAPTTAPAAKPPTAAGQPTIAVQPAATTAPKPAAGPRSGGQLRSGQLGDIVTLDPHFLQPSSESVWLSYDRLIGYDTQLKPQPMLAESWELSSDAKQLKVNLRKGVTFHTGREFTSDDVKYSITRAKDPKIGVGQYATQARWFQSVETPDKYTAILVADQRDPWCSTFSNT